MNENITSLKLITLLNAKKQWIKTLLLDADENITLSLGRRQNSLHAHRDIGLFYNSFQLDTAEIICSITVNSTDTSQTIYDKFICALNN